MENEELFVKIMKRIRKEQRFSAIKNACIFSVILVISAAALLPVFNMVKNDFEKTGFIYFVSLLFSDFSVIQAYWQSFSLILLETIPALSIALCMAALLAFLQSIKSLAKNIRIILILNHLAIG